MGDEMKQNDSKHHLQGEKQQDLEEIRKGGDNVLRFIINKN